MFFNVLDKVADSIFDSEQEVAASGGELQQHDHRFFTRTSNLGQPSRLW
jgi:hypothetical protein